MIDLRPTGQPQNTDNTVVSGQTYALLVAALDGNSDENGHSNQAQDVIPNRVFGIGAANSWNRSLYCRRKPALAAGLVHSRHNVEIGPAVVHEVILIRRRRDERRKFHEWSG
jgi:hypothetical protein